MIRSSFVLSLLFLAILGFTLPVVGDDTPATPKADPGASPPSAEKKDVADESIPDLIKQLDADSFPQRQAASQKLAELGKSAIPAITEAALGGNRETITRAIDLLKGHLKTGDESVKAAAKTALEKIASEGKGVAARQAEQALNPKKEENPVGPNFAPNGFQFGGGQVQIQFQVQAAGGGNNAKRVTTRNVNGVKTIEAEENGRKVKINDDPNKGIQIEVTETKDGKETTQKYEAKDAADLKEKHPDAHKLYEQYSQPAKNLPFQGAPNVVPGQVPLQIIPNGFQGQGNGGFGGPEMTKQMELRRLEGIAQALDNLGKQLKQISDKNPTSEELSKAIETLKKSREELLEAKTKLQAAEK